MAVELTDARLRDSAPRFRARRRAAEPPEALGKRLEQALARAHDPDRDRAYRDAEETRGLLVLHALPYTELEGAAIRLGKLSDGAFEKGHQILLLGSVVLVGALQSLENDCGRAFIAIALNGTDRRRRPAASPQRAQSLVARDMEQPRLESRAKPIELPFQEDLDEHFLCDVFGEVPVMDDSLHPRGEAVSIAIYQHGETGVDFVEITETDPEQESVVRLERRITGVEELAGHPDPRPRS